jgi:uncharacterized protein (DUF58 family)
MQKLWRWFEWHGAVPEFAGGLLLSLTVFLFGAATNTLAGWLYVISGVSLALLTIGALFPSRYLQELTIDRAAPVPVTVGSDLDIAVTIHNSGKTAKHLLQVRDKLPDGLCGITTQEIVLPSLTQGQSYQWQYTITAERRGVFYLSALSIATASPLGLFRSRRSIDKGEVKVVVYPLVLPLAQCPILEQLGREQEQQRYSPRHSQQLATEGLTRTLRPYRWGDPMRLIHWRTSAKYGDLRVRELETTIGGQEVTLALDTTDRWSGDYFEQAVMVCGSLYVYGQKLGLRVSFYCPDLGLLQGSAAILEALAQVQTSGAGWQAPPVPLLVITPRPELVQTLEVGDRFILWGEMTQSTPAQGISIVPPAGEPNLRDIQTFWQNTLGTVTPA